MSIGIERSAVTGRGWCSGCTDHRSLVRITDSDGKRYWTCRICWTQTLAQGFMPPQRPDDPDPAEAEVGP